MPVKKGTIGQRPQAVSKIDHDGAHARPFPPQGGACVGQPTDLWYPIGHMRGEKRSLSPASSAMRICHSCPVQLECLMYGLEWEQFGVWGGMSENSRKVIRAAMNITVARTDFGIE